MRKRITGKTETRVQAIYAGGPIHGASVYDLAMDYLVNGRGWHGPEAREALIAYGYTVAS